MKRCGQLLLLLLACTALSAQTPVPPARALRSEFARPEYVPGTHAGAAADKLAALGERLFHEPRLSANGKVSCATCHVSELGLADGVPLSAAGITGARLRRHTPSLWNVAWSPVLMWDGRAATLEQQAELPLSHPDEMGNSSTEVAARLAGDDDLANAFASAFPEEPKVTPRNLAAALAAYQRTLVSPPTRFDHWVAGNETALSDEEKAGFDIFAGKGGCAACHQGFAFTDYAFHDIGLPTDDPGRGPVAGLDRLRHAFKTPSLRELAWTAPYMHDGSMSALEEVVAFYEEGGVHRPSRSRELPRSLNLTPAERSALVAFLLTLSSDTPPRPSTESWVRRQPPAFPLNIEAGQSVSQKDKRFWPSALRISVGDRIIISNDDSRPHNVRILDDRMNINSGVQEPGESTQITFAVAGVHIVHCGIHPSMTLRVEVD